MEQSKNRRIRCGSCLTYLDPDARFCSQCGLSVGKTVGGEGTPPPPAAPGPILSAAAILRVFLLLLCIAGGIAGGFWLFERYGPDPANANPADSRTAPVSDLSPPSPSETEGEDTNKTVPNPGGEPGNTSGPLAPDALLAHACRSLFLFTGIDRDGRQNARCVAVETIHGVALQSRCLKGSYTAWVRAAEIGYEIERVLYFDDLLGSAVVRPEKEAPPLEIASPDTLLPGARIFLVKPATGDNPAAIIPGRFGGRTQDRNTGAPRLLFEGPPPGAEGAIAIDGNGRLIGIAPPDMGESPRPFLPATLFEPGTRAEFTTLADLNAVHYEGSFDALVRRARSLVSRGNFAEALVLFDGAREIDLHRGLELDREVLNAVLREASRLLGEKRSLEALDISTRRFEEFNFSSDLALLAFRAAAEAREFVDAADWAVTIRDLDAGLFEKIAGEHIFLCIEWSGSLLLRDDARGAISVLQNGIACRPMSAVLHENLGNMLKSVRDYQGAIAAYQGAIRLSSDLVPKVAPLIDLCYELLETPGSVVLDFDPRERRITCRALLDGRVWVNFIVDTGASQTSIPVAAAENLGIDVGHIKRRARIITAGGEKEVPYTLIKTLDLSGLLLKQDYVLINDLPSPEEGFGLLGLNFLNKFQYTVDAASGRMVLKQK
jgi:clan AA aspartic protease (TIGR02281 family)